ncbi:MAG: sulfurtransferase TusA family protein [Bacteroidales bacterium]|jgi:sulfite reductase (ferredoxin)|nr:sulfurtransferase TusA family protein [Bacteroidales bacterium]
MYTLPDTLTHDIERFGELAAEYEQKKIPAAQFKAFRVPMGVYEQRLDEVYMSRVRATGGVISPAQFLELIAIAQRHNSDLLHITTRQEIQIQNLKLNSVEPILHELQAIHLATKGGGGNTVRNIIVSEESGISETETFDTTPYAAALTTKLIAETDSYLLPRKLKIAFSSSEHNVDYAAVNDVGFVAKIRNGERGFQVYVGGGGGSNPTVAWVLFNFVPTEDLYAVAESVKKFFSEHGNRKNRHKARLRYIFYKLGEEETLRLLREYFAEAQKLQPKFVLNEDTVSANDCKSYFLNSLLVEEGEEAFSIWQKRYVSPQKQSENVSVLLPIFLGNISLADEKKMKGLQKLLHHISQFGENTLRFTTTQNIRLRNIPVQALPELYTILKTFVPEIAAPLLLNTITSCTGADTCRLGIGLSKGLAAAIRRELGVSKLNLDLFADVRINISGCPNSCGQQLWADIGFSGKVLRNNRAYPGYQVYLAAHRADNPAFAESVGTISARDIPKFLLRLFDSFTLYKENYASFPEFLKGKGRNIAAHILADYQEIPDFADDKNYYFDWGAEEIFTVVGRGTPECSAGLFDMIELDLNTINDLKKQLETAPANANEILYDIIFSASRMLLVTRGLEAKTTSEVFDLFLENFVKQGIVNKEFTTIVTLAKSDKNTDFTQHKTEIFALADALVELYKNMDDSLQFKNAQQPEKLHETKPEASLAKKDLRGVSCPMNFVQTKLQLSTLPSGALLEILLDDGAPINNVPGSVRGEGHEIVEQTKVENHWRVVIRKK